MKNILAVFIFTFACSANGQVNLNANVAASSTRAPNSGTVTSVSSANANISVATGTTTPVLTLGSDLTVVNSVTAAAGTDLTLNAGSGGNNFIAAFLAGTKPMKVGASGDTYSTVGALALGQGTTSAKAIWFGTDVALYRGSASLIVFTNGGARFMFTGSNGLLVGSTTDDGAHNLQVSGAGGISTNTIGGTLAVKSGANAKAGTFTLSSGAATVANTSVTANSVVVCTVKTSSGTLGTGSPEIVITAGTGFTATGIATDNSTYNFIVMEVN